MFTVLMSVYGRERPSALDAALQSLARQTVSPAEVLLVKDGPLGPELDAVVDRYMRELPLVTHALPVNVGLTRALNEGLHRVRQPWVMRFDSDDICVPHRVESQREMALNSRLSLFGAQILEFDNSPSEARRSRLVPTTHSEILVKGLLRNPFNHMTVCYRRDLALAVGGYPEIPFMEDYGLWMRMLAQGIEVANSHESLVFARIGNGMIARRGGLGYARSEWMLQRHMVALGLKSRPRAVWDGCRRSAVFLTPPSVRSVVYEHFLRARAGHE
jgi:glycosyltransferase involved in cell wall biosynthesis